MHVPLFRQGLLEQKSTAKNNKKKDLHISTQGNKTSLKAAMPRDCCFHLISSYTHNDYDDDDDNDNE